MPEGQALPLVLLLEGLSRVLGSSIESFVGRKGNRRTFAVLMIGLSKTQLKNLTKMVAKMCEARQDQVRVMRVAYQIHWLIEQTAGECTLLDMADFTGASEDCCRAICQWRGWATKYRKANVGSNEVPQDHLAIGEVFREFR